MKGGRVDRLMASKTSETSETWRNGTYGLDVSLCEQSTATSQDGPDLRPFVLRYSGEVVVHDRRVGGAVARDHGFDLLSVEEAHCVLLKYFYSVDGFVLTGGVLGQHLRATT
jgi:hypothetical protein